MNHTRQIHLYLRVDAEVIPFFYPLLGKGFDVCATMGVSIKAFLCEQIGLSPDYLENRIQTLFLDGKAVDDLNSALVESGSVLALSGAMPGLAGATFRRGGYYGKMRGEISHRQDTGAGTCGEGNLTVKLFNLILKELGPLFLKKGVLVDGDDFHQLLTVQPEPLQTGCRRVELDGKSIDPEKLKDIDWVGAKVFLQIQ